MRLLNLLVAATLILAAAYVYKIKFESTVQAERVAKLRAEIERERDAVAALRAEWSQLDNPARIQELARRHLRLKPLEPSQIDPLDRLPERPVEWVAPTVSDPVGAMIESLQPDDATGSVRAPRPAR
jgi:cell division protein FtsL